MPSKTAKLTELLCPCIDICFADPVIINAIKSVTFSQFLIQFWIILITGCFVVSCSI